METVSYGEDPDTFVEFYEPRPACERIFVIIHGGYWRQEVTCHSRLPLLDWLVDRGEAVANVEYRRGQRGPWPTPRDDVVSAAQLIRQRHPRAQIIAIGHSVGGELALLAAGEFDAVVALAPVTDVARVYDDRLGDDAAQGYFGPNAQRDVLQDASPLLAPVPEIPILIVQGSVDDRVPLDHTMRYLSSHAPGAAIDAQICHGAGHFDPIEPDHRSWRDAWAWIDQM